MKSLKKLNIEILILGIIENNRKLQTENNNLGNQNIKLDIDISQKKAEMISSKNLIKVLLLLLNKNNKKI